VKVVSSLRRFTGKTLLGVTVTVPVKIKQAAIGAQVYQKSRGGGGQTRV